MSPEPKPPKWLSKPYRTSSLSTMGYPKRSSWIKDKISRVSWWLTSVSWWGCRKCRPVHTICKPMASMKDSILPWSICLGPYPKKRSQGGRITLECWFMHTTAPRIQLHVQETTSSSCQCHAWFDSPQHPGEHPKWNFSGGFLDREGSELKDIWPSCNSPTYEK